MEDTDTKPPRVVDIKSRASKSLGDFPPAQVTAHQTRRARSRLRARPGERSDNSQSSKQDVNHFLRHLRSLLDLDYPGGDGNLVNTGLGLLKPARRNRGVPISRPRLYRGEPL